METDDIVKTIVDLHKEGYSTSKIGIVLRDQYGVPGTKKVLNKKVTRILEENGVRFEYPEDLMNLIKKAVNLRKHLEKNTRDDSNSRSLILIESKIKRLVRYYKKEAVLPKDYFYDPKEAALLVK